MSKIIYEPHPVNTARKAKLQAEGYKIIDAIFAPAGAPIHQKLHEEVAPVVVEETPSDEIDDAVEKLDDAVEEYIAEVSEKRKRSKKG
jgi:DNA-directed RNA polymerase subunit L